MKKYLGEGALLLNTIIWGGTFVIIKSALQDSSPMLFLGIRFLIAAIILLPFAPKIFKGVNKKTLWGGILLGLLFFFGFAAQTIGLKYTTATKSGFITGTFVVFIPFLQYIIEKKIPTKMNVAGVFFVFIGLILLSGKSKNIFNVFTEIGDSFNVGDVLTLLCAIIFAVYMVYLDKITKVNPYMPLVFLQISVTGISAILVTAFTFVFGFENVYFNFTPNLLIALLYTSLLATVLTTTLQTKFQKVVTPTKAGIILSFEPIFAAVSAFFILGEKVSNFGLIGCILIFTGLLTAELFDKK